MIVSRSKSARETINQLWSFCNVVGNLLVVTEYEFSRLHIDQGATGLQSEDRQHACAVCNGCSGSVSRIPGSVLGGLSVPRTHFDHREGALGISCRSFARRSLAA